MERGATTHGTRLRGARTGLAGIGAAAALALLAACTGSPSGTPGPAPGGTATGNPSGAGSAFTGTVTVGSADFTEDQLLGEIYAQALEARHINVQRKLTVTSRDILFKEVQSGAITVVPEYNGALLSYLDRGATADATDTVDAALQGKLPPQLEILDSAQAQDNDTLVVTKANQVKYGLYRISDLYGVATKWTIGAPPQFKDSQRGLVGLQNSYGLTFKAFKPLDDAGPVSISALQDNNVQVIDLASTAPQIKAQNLAALDDDMHVFGVQNVTPLAYKAGMPQAAVDAINAVSASLDTATLTGLVDQVVTGNRDVDAVADQWLISMGLK